MQFLSILDRNNNEKNAVVQSLTEKDLEMPRKQLSQISVFG